MSHGIHHARFIGFGLLAFVAALSASAAAQNAPAGARLPDEPASPPVAPTPASPEPTVAPTATPAVAPTPDEPRPDDPAAKEPKRQGKHKKHKHKHRDEREDVAPLATQAETAPAGPDYGGLVFSSSGGSLQLKGRLFALAELSHRSETVFDTSGNLTSRDVDALDLSLASARLGVEYHSPMRWLSAELELDLAGKPQVKDAFIQAGKKFFVKAGQFKVPTAALELESPWALPTARRGLVHDLLTDWLDVAGRRPGVLFGYRCKCELKPRIMLGAFQGTTMSSLAANDREVDLIDKASLKAQSLAARAEVRLAGIDVGAWYEHRVGSQEIAEFAHYATFGLDAGVDKAFDNGGLRLWLDGTAGKSFYVNADKPGAGDPLFMVGRALAAYRFGGVALGDPYVEPFGFVALFDPDSEVVSDFATEGALGVNAGYWDRARLTLQAEMTNSQRNFPTGFLENYDPQRLSVLLQAGARF